MTKGGGTDVEIVIDWDVQPPTKTIKVKNISGNKVETNQAMYSYLRGIEEIAAINPKTKIYNLCSHGAQIDNVTPLGSANELMKFLNKY